MSDRLQELTVFVRAAEGGSFSRAGRELNLSQPSVSRIVSELERRLGVKLLLRSTRSVSLTDAGTVFLDRARAVLAEIEEAEDAARGADSLRGTIRLALPMMYGVREIIPRLPDFLAAHPLMRIEMTVRDELQNLVAEGVDIAIRLGTPADSAYGAKKLATLDRFLVAAPRYLADRGTPTRPADMAGHDCIIFPGGSGRGAWSFKKGNSVISVDVRGRIITNSAPGTLASALAGLGIAMASSVLCRDELEAGSLVRLLPGYALDSIDVHAIFPAGPKPSAKARALADYLAANICGRSR